MIARTVDPIAAKTLLGACLDMARVMRKEWERLVSHEDDIHYSLSKLCDALEDYSQNVEINGATNGATNNETYR